MSYQRVTPRARNGVSGISVDVNLVTGQGVWINPPDRIAAVTVAVHINGAAFVNGKLKADYVDVDSLTARIFEVESITARSRIASSNFYGADGTESGNGFMLDAESGEIKANNGVFNNVIIKESSVFRGDIISGPLILNNNNPSSIIDTYSIKKGESTQTLYNWIKNKNQLSGIISANILIGEMVSRGGLVTPSQSANYLGVFHGYKNQFYNIYFFDKNLNRIQCKTHTTYPYDDNKWGYQNLEFRIYSVIPGDTCTMPCNLQIGFYNPSGKTFKLLDLPTNEPNQIGSIWVDAGGYLRIKT